MTMTPEPTDQLDAAASRGERTRGRDQRTAVISADLHGLLEPDAGRLARPVLRGAERREALGLPDRCGSQVGIAADYRFGTVASNEAALTSAAALPYLPAQRRARAGGGGEMLLRSADRDRPHSASPRCVTRDAMGWGLARTGR